MDANWMLVWHTWELTYPPPQGIFEDHFPFPVCPFGGICVLVPWRVDVGVLQWCPLLFCFFQDLRVTLSGHYRLREAWGNAVFFSEPPDSAVPWFEKIRASKTVTLPGMFDSSPLKILPSQDMGPWADQLRWVAGPHVSCRWLPMSHPCIKCIVVHPV